MPLGKRAGRALGFGAHNGLRPNEDPQKWGLRSDPPSADDDHDMPKLTAKDLAEHVEQLAHATVEDLDELLTDLLVQVYPTKPTQDS
jgi:hypothetical protein